MAQDETIARELFIASNSFDHSKLIEKVTPETVNTLAPESMLHEFSTKYSLLENSIKNKDDFMADYLISNGANIESYKIVNEINGNERKHNPIGLAIVTGNENALYNMLDKRPDLLNESHIELLHKAAINRELTPAETRDIALVIDPVCKDRGINFDQQSLNLMHDLKATQDDNFKTFYNQVLNSNLPGLVEHSNSKELSEFSAVLRHTNGELIYSGEFKYGKKDGLHFNMHNDTLTVSNFDKGREIPVPKDVEIFVALRNDNLKQIENLTSRATIDRLQPDNIDFFPKYEQGKLSLIESAITENKNDIAKFLIDKGCDLKPYEIKDLQTQEVRLHDPLMTALKNDNKEMFDYAASKKPELVTLEHRQEIERMQKGEKYNQIRTIGTEHVLSETEKQQELNKQLKSAIQDGRIDEAKDAILKGADTKTIVKSDLANLSDEVKHNMINTIQSGVIEQAAKDDLGHLGKKPDEIGGIKI